MTGWWLASYLVLWVIVVLLCLLQVGTLRELALARHETRTSEQGGRPLRTAEVGPGIGSRLPDLELSRVNGGIPVPIRRDDGAQTLMVFLTPMCKGCQAAAELLGDLAETNDVSRTTLRVVLCAPEQTCKAFLSVFPLEAFVAIDPEFTVSNLFDVHVYPFGLLYDGTDVLVRKGVISNEKELTAVLGDDLVRVHTQVEAL